MTLSQHYKCHSRKSLKPYVSLLILIVLFINVFHTFARQLNTVNAHSLVNIANWSIYINNEPITSSTTNLSNTFNLLNALDDTTSIDAGDECNFDLTINPSTTEVALSLGISIDLSSQSNTLPIGTIIEKYEKYTGSTYQLASTTSVNNTTVSIEEDINLPNAQTTLGSSDIRKYRIYFSTNLNIIY